ncbi:MAG TPA: NAD(P)/FAD-dependent oxidoreductase, partial [Bryobacteraceae bacterium]|nr:NAD(P)/FAD-dependent oxidoreductase [Bryobacteraceae bacterium]
FLFHNDTPKRFVTDTLLVAPRAGAARLSLRKPLVIYSRLDLNRMLLERASRAGARIEKTRVLEVTRNGNWAIRTTGGTIEADFCIVATGARNSLKNMGTRLTPADTMRALGYYVPGDQKHIDIQFLPQLEGYIWVFPRCGHLSVGICGKGVPAQDLRLRLERFMEERRISTKDGRFYSHLLPSLGSSGWRNNRVAGQGWLAVGDAAGLVDPITGEGIYYAMRSGDLASQVVLSDAHPPAEKHRAYRALLVRDFAADLAYGAAIARRFFLGKFLFRSVPERMVAFLRRSPRFYDLMQDLFAGTQPYSSLKNRLLRNLHGTFLDIFLNLLFHRPEVAEENQV